MHVAETFHDGVHEVLDLAIGHSLLVGLDNIHKVLAAVLHDQVDTVEVFWVSWSHYSLELYDVLVASEDSHELHLSKEPVGVNVTVKHILD